MPDKLYFAYGSNTNLDQMRYRCPDAKVIDTVTLPDYELLFRGSDGSGLATIEPKQGSVVHGLLWRITPRCERSLDRYEGFPSLYDKRDVTVRDSHGRSISVMAYVMVGGRRLQPARPSGFYYQGILDGYRQTGLPVEALGDALEHARREVKERARGQVNLWEVMEPDNEEPLEEQNDAPSTLYFAYGSNINLDQMAHRCPDAEPVCNVVLDNHSLAFRGRNDGNGVATIVPHKGRKVYGVLWKLTPNCEKSLDRWEGCPVVYDKQTVNVRDADGNRYAVMTYAMTHEKTREPAMPSEAYFQRIQDGYAQNGLPTRSLSLALQRIRDEVAERRRGVNHSDKPDQERKKKGQNRHER